VRDAILRICTGGDALAATGHYDDALAEYRRAWAMIPSPRRRWSDSAWILGAFADAYFLSGRRDLARAAIDRAMACPGGSEQPFLHLRLGQILLDAGDPDGAAAALARAYWDAGEDVFVNEDERYLTFLKGRGLAG
jgi:tetratricopeptide (TPR) repeat protein